MNDIDSLKMWLWATVGIMSIMTAILGYFLSNRDAEIKKRDETVQRMLSNMSEVIEQLKTIVNGIQINQTIRQPILEQQLEHHRKNIDENTMKIEKIDLRLTTIETEHKNAYCKYPQYSTRKKSAE